MMNKLTLFALLFLFSTKVFSENRWQTQVSKHGCMMYLDLETINEASAKVCSDNIDCTSLTHHSFINPSSSAPILKYVEPTKNSLLFRLIVLPSYTQNKLSNVKVRINAGWLNLEKLTIDDRQYVGLLTEKNSEALLKYLNDGGNLEYQLTYFNGFEIYVSASIMFFKSASSMFEACTFNSSKFDG